MELFGGQLARVLLATHQQLRPVPVPPLRAPRLVPAPEVPDVLPVAHDVHSSRCQVDETDLDLLLAVQSRVEVLEEAEGRACRPTLESGTVVSKVQNKDEI